MKCRSLVLFVVLLVVFAGPASAQDVGFERGRHKAILGMVKDDVKKNYFDPEYRGIDVEAKFKDAMVKLDQATSIGQLNGIIAQFLVAFDDSHLFFVPPGKVNKSDYGFKMRMVGDKCFIVYVEKETDAEKKGLKAGDEISDIYGYLPTRDNFWKLQYLLYRLRPQPTIVITETKPGGRPQKIEILAKVTQGKKITDLTGNDINAFNRMVEDEERKETRQYVSDKVGGVFVWKMPSFSLDPGQVDEMFGRIKKSSSLVSDLRGNSGGRVDMLLRVVANLFPEDVKVSDEKGRKETKEIIAKSRGKSSFTGKVVVLIDSGSASASEVLAKVIQLERRGDVIGDRSSGAVMESRFFPRAEGIDTVVFFGTSVTIADLIMKDGKSLEKVGVTPNKVVLVSGDDLAQKRDPVMAAAFQLLGLNLSAEEAGSMFPGADDNK